MTTPLFSRPHYGEDSLRDPGKVVPCTLTTTLGTKSLPEVKVVPPKTSVTPPIQQPDLAGAAKAVDQSNGFPPKVKVARVRPKAKADPANWRNAAPKNASQAKKPTGVTTRVPAASKAKAKAAAAPEQGAPARNPISAENQTASQAPAPINLADATAPSSPPTPPDAAQAILAAALGDGATATQTAAVASGPPGKPDPAKVEAFREKHRVKVGWWIGAELKTKNFKNCTAKAHRDWQDILRSLSNTGVVVRGYDIPYTKSIPGKKKSAENLAVYRIAVDHDDLDILNGRTEHTSMFRCLRSFLLHYWFTMITILPWVVYQLYCHYDFELVAYHAVTLNKTGMESHEHHRHLLFCCALIGASFNYCFPDTCLEWFSWKQKYILIKMSTQINLKAYSEVWNGEQEKTTPQTVACSPGQTRLANDCRELAKDMHPSKILKFALMGKFLLAATALGICEDHDFAEDESSVESEEMRSAAFKRAEHAQNIDLHKFECEVLECRNIDFSIALPKPLRDGVRVFEKSEHDLFEERQYGRKICCKDDIKSTEVSCVFASPQLVEIISGLARSRVNEFSGVTRHCGVLKRPDGTLLPPVAFDVERRLNQATGIIAELMVAALGEPDVLGIVAEFNVPPHWSATMRETVPEQCEQARQNDGNTFAYIRRKLSGFTKTHELMLGLAKHARLVGTLGATANMEDAMSIGPIERLMKHSFRHLVTKGMDQRELDCHIADMLSRMHLDGYIIESDDYSAMDSSWTFNDRRRLRWLAECVLEPVRQYLLLVLRNMDHVTQASEKGQKIVWCLNYLKVLMDPENAILFSGERMTSLFNRLLVLILQAAEDIRMWGLEKGKEMITHTWKGTKRRTQGDGDDVTEAIKFDPSGETLGTYLSQQHRVDCYAAMGKLLTPCSSPVENRDCEILSRFHIYAGPIKGYIHIAKMARNMGRLIAFKINRPNEEPGIKKTQLSQKEMILICTDVWQRCFTLQSTLAVRQYAKLVFMHVLSKVEDKTMSTLYSEEDLRGGRVADGDRKLYDCMRDIEELLANAPTSANAMVKASHFMDYHLMTPEQIVREQEEWWQADHILAGAEITDAHMLDPVSFMEDYTLPYNVMNALGFRKECLDIARKREALDLEDTVEAAAQLETGKLADVADPANAGGGVGTTAEPTSETLSATTSTGASGSGGGNTIITPAALEYSSDGCVGASSGPDLEAFEEGNDITGLIARVIVNTLGEPKSNATGVYVAPTPDLVGSVINAPMMPPGLQLSGITPELIMMIAHAVVSIMTGGVGATGPSTQDVDARQARFSTTSRDPLGTGSQGGVDAGWTRTNPLSRGGIVDTTRRLERCGKPTSVDEPAGVPKTQVSPESGAVLGSAVNVQDPLRPYSKGGNIEDLTNAPIVEGGNESHGVEKANRRDRRANAANASQSSAFQERVVLQSKQQRTTTARPASPVLRSPAEWRQRRLERKASAASLAEPDTTTEGGEPLRSERRLTGTAKPPSAPAKGRARRWCPLRG